MPRGYMPRGYMPVATPLRLRIAMPPSMLLPCLGDPSAVVRASLPPEPGSNQLRSKNFTSFAPLLRSSSRSTVSAFARAW